MTIHFKNEQWTVTDYGVEAIRGSKTPNMIGATGSYEFSAKRLLETTDRGAQKLYDWPVHMAEKTWVDIELFIEVFVTALKVHGGHYPGEVDPDMLNASLTYARKEARGRY